MGYKFMSFGLEVLRFPHQQLTSPFDSAVNAVTSCTFVPLLLLLQLSKPVPLIRPVLAVPTPDQSMKWIVRLFIALCCLTRRAHNGFIKAEVSFGWQWLNGPCAVCWQQGRGCGRGEGLMSVFIQGSARVAPVSATSEQMCNWCWDSPGVPSGSTLSLFFFFFRYDGHCRGGGDQSCLPPLLFHSLPSSQRTTQSQEWKG